MEITRRTDYAIRILLELASLAPGDVVPTRRLGELQDVPPAFARAIAQDLVGAGFLASRRGASGGVSLARPAHEISLLQVVEAMEGPVSLNLCTHDPDYCSRPGSCAMHEVWKDVETHLTAYLASCDFDTLAVRQTAVRRGGQEAAESAPSEEETLGDGPAEEAPAATRARPSTSPRCEEVNAT